MVGRRSSAFFLLAVLSSACASGGPENDEGDHEDWFDENVADQVSQRWMLPPELAEQASAWRVRSDGAPAFSTKNCTGTFEPGLKELSDYVKQEFTQVTSIGGYSCRANTANKRELSIHGTGRAIDIFIPLAGPRTANNELGDPVANWLVLNAELLGLQYIIWDRSSWSGSRETDKFRPYDGPHPHHDHIHMELNEVGAARMAEWFTNGHIGLDGAGGSPWLGSACTDNAGCTFDAAGNTPTCAAWFDDDEQQLHGFCTIGCETFCPDLAGHAPTFCVASSAGGGQCVAVADASNDDCAKIPGTEPIVLSRYTGTSGASPAIATVCAQPDRQGVACSASSGECIDTDVMTCPSATLSGQCPGGADIRCCPF